MACSFLVIIEFSQSVNSINGSERGGRNIGLSLLKNGGK